MPYHILLIEASIFPIDSLVMTRYLTYKHKIFNMEDKRLPMITSNPIQNHIQLKQSWHKDAKDWLNHWKIKEEVTLQNIDNIKNAITPKFKEKLWRNIELEDNKRLRYYKEVINPNLEVRKYLFVLTCIKKKINFAKMRMNSHKPHYKTRHWEIPKLPLVKEFVIFMTLRELRIKNNFSYSVVHPPTLDLNFKIYVAISHFLTF